MSNTDRQPDQPDRCSACGGLNQFVDDIDAPYRRCLQCGRWRFLDPSLEVPGEKAAERGEGWYPVRGEKQALYRQIREIILRERLSAKAAIKRFSFSRRTYYRIRDGERLDD